jgi:hypothetical protein
MAQSYALLRLLARLDPHAEGIADDGLAATFAGTAERLERAAAERGTG